MSLDWKASCIFYRDYIQGILFSMFYYIYIGLYYMSWKIKVFFSMLDEELWIYMDLNIKAYDPYSFISSLN
jgi:hypothetical protein